MLYDPMLRIGAVRPSVRSFVRSSSSGSLYWKYKEVLFANIQQLFRLNG